MTKKFEQAQRTELIGTLLERAADGPAPRFLFVRDPNRLMEGALWVSFRGETRAPVFYRNPLALRDALEGMKDAEGAFPLAIVALTGEPANLNAVADLTSRGSFASIAPCAAMSLYSPDYTWSPVLDLLHGDDFWNLMPALAETRKRWGPSAPSSQIPTLIAEAFLERPLREPISEEDALELWRQTEEEERIIHFLGRNRAAAEAVQAAIQRSVSIEQKLARDPDFAAFLWTTHFLRKYGSNPQLLMPQFFNAATWTKYSAHSPEELSNVCSELLKSDPERAISHVRIAERSVAQLPERERLFFNLLGLDGEKKTETALRIASEETVSGYITERCLRTLLPRAVGSPGSISKSRLEKLRRVLNQKHLGAQYPSYYPSLGDSASLFLSTLRLSEMVETFYEENWENRFDQIPVEEWMDALYPQRIAPMTLLRDELAGRRAQGEPMLAGEPEALLNEANRILAVCDYAFAAAVERNYIRWIARQSPPPALTVDFLDVIFLPEWKRLRERSRLPLAAICLLHGMRWDEWETIAPVFTQRLVNHRLEETRPVMALLPTNWSYNTGSLILGRFPSLSDTGPAGELLADRLAAESIDRVEASAGTHLQFPEIRRGVVFANVSLNGTGARKTRRTGESKEALLKAAEEQLGPFLERIPPRASVFVLSNGGTCETYGPPETIEAGADEIQPRWTANAKPSHRKPETLRAAVFNSEAIRFPNPHIAQCAFAYPSVRFAAQPEQPERAFHSGGVSLGEMIVPCSLFRSKRS